MFSLGNRKKRMLALGHKNQSNGQTLGNKVFDKTKSDSSHSADASQGIMNFSNDKQMMYEPMKGVEITIRSKKPALEKPKQRKPGSQFD